RSIVISSRQWACGKPVVHLIGQGPKPHTTRELDPLSGLSLSAVTGRFDPKTRIAGRGCIQVLPPTNQRDGVFSQDLSIVRNRLQVPLPCANPEFAPCSWTLCTGRLDFNEDCPSYHDSKARRRQVENTQSPCVENH